MAAKLTDVAKHAGVAVGTVSNVLNHPERVSTVVKERVQSSIEELGYVRNVNAASLRSGVYRVVAMVVVEIGDPYFSLVASEVEKQLSRHNLMLVFSSTNSEPERERDISNTMVAQQMSGVILTPTSLDMGAVQRLTEAGTPVVLFDHPSASATVSSVCADDVTGAAAAVTLLLDLGHRDLCFVNGPERSTQAQERLQGFLQAVAEYPTGETVRTKVVNAEEWTAAAGRLCAEGILSEGRPIPTGFFCGNDILAVGVTSALNQAGFSIPQDASVIGFDDLPISRELSVPLTTVHRSTKAMAQASVDALLSKDQPQHKIIPTYLVIRDSTGPVPDSPR